MASDALDKLSIRLALHEAAGNRNITVPTKLLRWLVDKARKPGKGGHDGESAG